MMANSQKKSRSYLHQIKLQIHIFWPKLAILGRFCSWHRFQWKISSPPKRFQSYVIQGLEYFLLFVEFQKNILTWGTLQCAGNLSFKLLVCLATDNLEGGRVYQSFKGSYIVLVPRTVGQSNQECKETSELNV